jgi:hypothetical protein
MGGIRMKTWILILMIGLSHKTGTTLYVDSLAVCEKIANGFSDNYVVDATAYCISSISGQVEKIKIR